MKLLLVFFYIHKRSFAIIKKAIVFFYTYISHWNGNSTEKWYNLKHGLINCTIHIYLTDKNKNCSWIWIIFPFCLFTAFFFVPFFSFGFFMFLFFALKILLFTWRTTEFFFHLETATWSCYFGYLFCYMIHIAWGTVLVRKRFFLLNNKRNSCKSKCRWKIIWNCSIEKLYKDVKTSKI